jgi:hypothetical protein
MPPKRRAFLLSRSRVWTSSNTELQQALRSLHTAGTDLLSGRIRKSPTICSTPPASGLDRGSRLCNHSDLITTLSAVPVIDRNRQSLIVSRNCIGLRRVETDNNSKTGRAVERRDSALFQDGSPRTGGGVINLSRNSLECTCSLDSISCRQIHFAKRPFRRWINLICP